eukprot:1156347-Pelagomonas_calceolata.AAC.4
MNRFQKERASDMSALLRDFALAQAQEIGGQTWAKHQERKRKRRLCMPCPALRIKEKPFFMQWSRLFVQIAPPAFWSWTRGQVEAMVIKCDGPASSISKMTV